MWQIECAKCEEFLKTLPENCIDSLVTDPPYGLSTFNTQDIIECLKCWLNGVPYHHSKKGFMSKEWDSFVPGPEIWHKIYRVMKPGAHGVVFAGTRTVDLMGISLRLAGFECRDMCAWLHGQGFPKSLNISKALDREAGANRPVIGTYAAAVQTNYCGTSFNASKADNNGRTFATITLPVTDTAKQFDGWGTALKPVLEPILLIRKPISELTIAKNVLKWGTGGINIDACRIEINGEVVPINKLENWSGFGEEKCPDYEAMKNIKGRWPANVITDGSDEVTGLFPYTEKNKAIPTNKIKETLSAARFFYCAKCSPKEREAGLENFETKTASECCEDRKPNSAGLDNPSAGAGRTQGHKNDHPTIKPIALMKYLITLITPPNGAVLDPFCGSGSTGCAAVQLPCDFLGIEMDSYDCDIAKARIEYWEKIK